MAVNTQPLRLLSPTVDFYLRHSRPADCLDEKQYSNVDFNAQTPSLPHERHCRCARTRVRRALTAALLALLGLGVLLLVLCAADAVVDGGILSALGIDASEGTVASALGWAGEFVKRQADGSGTNDDVFVHHKLYLIVVFVGLFLVLLAAICCSFWCCRGVFENPLCFPCYLCAWCGCMSCLECLACGLHDHHTHCSIIYNTFLASTHVFILDNTTPLTLLDPLGYCCLVRYCM
ncbi:hypothetical protein OBBRIDRAFT_661607 [Obba rivulosa]|uniref:Uncharacterized protein n=1 Tax=Obba rivulosa TaxID=1052685 RepID=A0A8E2DJY4_9APHY|nr:hypothetical protein OBBRIDRAFT_661607 [Obba rivulosa]